MLALCQNNHLALISLSGADSQSFLNNISTRSVGTEAFAGAQLNAFCNNKGRVISLFFLIDRQPGYWLIVPVNICERILKLLQLYRLRAQVDIDTPSDWCVMTLVSEPTDAVNFDGDDLFPQGAIEGDRLTQDSGQDLPVFAVGRRTRRSLVLTKNDEAASISERIDNCRLVNDNQAWNLATILDAQPWLESEQSEIYVPQSLDLDREPLSVCSLDKGCYPGQEIIARMHYLGKRKRGLFHCQANEAMQPGGKLYNTSTRATEVGTILLAATTAFESAHCVALAEVPIDAVDEDGRLCDDSGMIVTARRCYPEPASA